MVSAFRTKLRAYLALIAALALSSCDSDQVWTCEAQLKDRLKSPASYNRVSVETVQIGSSIHKPPYDEVTITYDAANSFNALLRDKETCFFEPATTNRFDNPFAKEVDAEVQKLNEAALKAADEAMNGVQNDADKASGDVNESQGTISPEGAEKLGNAVRANRAEALDACLENASSTEDDEKCNTEYGAPE